MAAMTTINTSNDLIKGENMNENTSQNQDSYPKVYGFSLFDAIFIILSLLAVVVDCFTGKYFFFVFVMDRSLFFCVCFILFASSRPNHCG